jgi:DNA-binding NarL/FixJ family response regulator
MAVETRREHGFEERIRVLVVDDSELFRAGLRTLLSGEGFDMADCGSGEAAVLRVRSFSPHVVLMDLRMPGMSGIEATPLVLAADPRTSVMIFTGACDGPAVLEAVRAGASGYLLKDADLADIIKAIRVTAAGHSAIAPEVAGALLTSVREGFAAPCDGPPIGALSLSVRERQVLALLATGCDNLAIARRLYISPSTVKNHVSRLLDKLGVQNRVQAAGYAIRHGLVDDAVAPAPLVAARR